MSHLISFSRYQKNVLLNSYLDSWWQILRFFLDQPLNQWVTGKKEGKTKIEKFKYLKSEKSFLDEIKNIFHSFLKGYYLVKNKNLIKKSGHKL